MPERQPPRRPGGRASRVLAAIYTAVGELMAEGVTKMSFPVIAERAGVNPTTLYRRWTDVDVLMEEVSVAALTRDGELIPNTGSFESDLTEWACIIARDISRPPRTRYLRAMVAARVDTMASCPVMEIRRQQALDMVSRGRAREERTPTVEQILDHVIAPLYHHVAFALKVDDGYARVLVSDAMALSR